MSDTNKGAFPNVRLTTPACCGNCKYWAAATESPAEEAVCVFPMPLSIAHLKRLCNRNWCGCPVHVRKQPIITDAVKTA